MILTKLHKADKRKIVTLCDKDLIGKVIEDEELQLDVSEKFYNGSVLEEGEMIKEIESASSLNIVGEESIKFALKHKLINQDNLIKIKSVPHAIVISL